MMNIKKTNLTKSTITALCLLNGILAVNGQALSHRIDSVIEKAVRLNRFNGSVLVSMHGKIVYEKAYGYQDVSKKLPNTPQTIYQIGSTTKEFTAAIILKLAESHQLDLTDKLDKYFPDFRRGNEISIQNLLTHSSGIYEILRDPGAFNSGTKPRTKDQMLAFFINKPLDFDPGTQYSYCNSGYMLLGLIIEKITGKPYEEVVREMILRPLEMTHSGFDFASLRSRQKAIGYSKYNNTLKVPSQPWDSTATYSAGALYTSVGDLYKWHKGLLHYQVYNQASLERATTPFLAGYGLGCWIDTVYNKKLVSHGGNIFGFTGYFGRIQEDDVCIILLNNIFNRNIENIGLSILAILYNHPYSYFDEVKLAVDKLEKYVGEYAVNDHYKVKITRTTERLFITRNNGPAREIFAYKENSFFQKDDDIRVSFQSEKDSINKIIIMEGLSTKRGDRIVR